MLSQIVNQSVILFYVNGILSARVIQWGLIGVLEGTNIIIHVWFSTRSRACIDGTPLAVWCRIHAPDIEFHTLPPCRTLIPLRVYINIRDAAMQDITTPLGPMYRPTTGPWYLRALVYGVQPVQSVGVGGGGGGSVAKALLCIVRRTSYIT